MKVFLSKRSQSGAAIAEAMDLPLVHRMMPGDEDFVEALIRWGSTREFPYDIPQLNSAEAIKLAANKPEARRALQIAGVPAPLTAFDVEWAAQTMGYPIVCRKAKHKGGSGFWLVQNEARLLRAASRGAAYFSEYYPKTDEYRVHVGSGKILLVSIKEGGDKTAKYWNHDKSGFTLRHLHRYIWREDTALQSMVETAIEAVRVLGLDYGAVDMLTTTAEDYEPHVVCEVNTTPGLSPLAISKYKDYFQGWLDNV